MNTAPKFKTLTPADCIRKFGQPGGPKEGTYMSSWYPPADILQALKHVVFAALGTKGFPAKVYCNNAIKAPLELALRNLMARGLTKELKTWDGCYVLRKMRGADSLSLHAWGVAVDVNQAENQLNQTPKLSPQFVQAFTDAGFEWGGTWQRKDGMHFQLVNL